MSAAGRVITGYKSRVKGTKRELYESPKMPTRREAVFDSIEWAGAKYGEKTASEMFRQRLLTIYVVPVSVPDPAQTELVLI